LFWKSYLQELKLVVVPGLDLALDTSWYKNFKAKYVLCWVHSRAL